MLKTLIILLLLLFGFSCNNGEYDLGKGYKYFYNRTRNYLTLNDSILIGNKITDYDYNDNYIIVYRIIQKENLYKEGVYELYIINKSENLKYGPLNFDEFIQLRQKLKIDENLELNINI